MNVEYNSKDFMIKYLLFLKSDFISDVLILPCFRFTLILDNLAINTTQATLCVAAPTPLKLTEEQKGKENHK